MYRTEFEPVPDSTVEEDGKHYRPYLPTQIDNWIEGQVLDSMIMDRVTHWQDGLGMVDRWVKSVNR